MATVSSDLIWEITRGNSSTLVKRTQAGGVQFSRDPLNLKNSYSRKYEGLVADQAIGIQPAEEGGLTLLTKKADQQHAPASHLEKTTLDGKSGNRSTYKSVVDSTTKKGYRPDLRKDAVARTSAIRKSQRPVKADKPTKLRGAKAKAAAAA